MKPTRIYLLLFLALAAFTGITACSRATATHTPMPTLAPGGTERTLVVEGQARSYLLYVPPGLDSSQPVPVVLGVHGYSSTPQRFRDVSGFNPIAEANGFLAVYPQGEGGDRSWNAGGCCGGAGYANLEDVDFVRQLLSDLKTIANLDPKRIYATGHSNGAMFVYRLACEMSDTFAAIAPVAGPLYYSPCEPEEAVSVIHVHGAIDTAVPYGGGQHPINPNLTYPSVPETLAAWAKLDGCESRALVDDRGDIVHTTYSSCESDAAIELYVLRGLGHTWPQPEKWPASQMIWEFFAAHPKP